MNKKARILIASIILTGLAVTIILMWGNIIFNPFVAAEKDEQIYSGTAEADEINITSELPGRIKELKIQEGQKISAGDLVASIDSVENSLKLEQSEIALENARNELGKVNEGNRVEEIKGQQAAVSQAESAVRQGESLYLQAQNNYNTAKINYDYKLKLYENIKSLYDEGKESKTALDSSQNALDNAKNVLDNSSAAVNIAKAQLEGYKAQLSGAKQKLNMLVNGSTERTKNTAQYSVDIADVNYKLLKLAVEKSSIKSPLDGVIQTVNYKVGEYVTPGSPVAVLLNMKDMFVKIYVPEKVLTLINIDKDVTLKSEFLKDRIIRGKITYISPEAEFTPVNIVTKKDREKLVFAVKVKILDNLESIKPGMLLDVNFQK